jgi:hypothetical protein
VYSLVSIPKPPGLSSLKRAGIHLDRLNYLYQANEDFVKGSVGEEFLAKAPSTQRKKRRRA